MRTALSTGRTVRVAAPAAVTSGQGVLVGTALFGIAGYDAAQNAPVELSVVGEFIIAKDPAVAMAVGDRLFWDNTNRRVNKTAAGQICVGVATTAQLAADATVQILLSSTPPAGA